MPTQDMDRSSVTKAVSGCEQRKVSLHPQASSNPEEAAAAAAAAKGTLEEAVYRILEKKSSKRILEEAVHRLTGEEASRRILEDAAKRILKEHAAKRILGEAATQILNDQTAQRLLSEEYREKMEDLFSRSPDSIDDRVLDLQNCRRVNGVVQKLLDMELSGGKGGGIPPRQDHVTCLQCQIRDCCDESVQVTTTPTPTNPNNPTTTTNTATTTTRSQRRKARREEDHKQRVIKKEAEDLQTRRTRCKNAVANAVAEIMRRKQAAAEAELKRLAEEENPQYASSPKTEPKTSIKWDSASGRPLPALNFHLTTSRVVMGMMVQGKPKLLENEFCERFTPAIVGLTEENHLLYGTEAASKLDDEDKEQTTSAGDKVWLIGQHFVSDDSPWSEEITINGEKYTLTVELLLGFLLRKLKNTVEDDLGGTVSTTVIAVPFWFTSSQRIQVKDAARIAGFSEVFLIHETSAAAFACASAETRKLSASNIVVLCENSGYIDVAVYSCDGFMRNISMVSQTGSYNLEKPKRGRFKEAAHQICKNVFNTDRDQDVKFNVEELSKVQAFRTVNKVFDAAICQFENPRVLSTNTSFAQLESVAVGESHKWQTTLDSLGRQYASKLCDIREDELVIMGAALLSQKPHNLGESIKDKLAFAVVRTFPPETEEKPLHKEFLPITTVRRSCELLPGKSEVNFYQPAMGAKALIGSLKVHAVPPPRDLIAVGHLTVTHEGIVYLKDVTYEKLTIAVGTTMNGKSLPKEDYTWTTPNLEEERIVDQMALLEYVLAQESIKNRDLSPYREA